MHTCVHYCSIFLISYTIVQNYLNGNDSIPILNISAFLFLNYKFLTQTLNRTSKLSYKV